MILLLSYLNFPNGEDQRLQYMSLVNQAAREIMVSNYKASDSLFEIAFREPNKPFYEEYNKYIFVNYKLGNKEKTFELLKKVAQEFPISFASIKSKFDYCPLTIKQWQEVEKIAKKRIKPIDQNLRQQIVGCNMQYFYSIIDEYSNEEIYSNRNKKIDRDSTHIIHSKIFVETINKYGFPSERRIGVDLDSEKQMQNMWFILGTWFIKYNDDILPLFEQAMKDGHIHPSIFAAISDYAYINTKKRIGKNYMNTTVHLVDHNPYKPLIHYTDSLLRLIDANRAAIGLDSFYIAQQQVMMSAYNTNQNCKAFVNVYTYPFIDDMPSGFVKRVFQDESIDLETYRLPKPSSNCNCVVSDH